MPQWLDVSAILWGMGAALALSLLGGVVVGGVLAARDEAENPDDPSDEIDFNKYPAIWTWVMALSLLASLVSGAVTGWLAETAPLGNAAVLAALTLLLHLVMRDRDAPAWLDRASALAMPPCVLLAAWLAG